VLAAINFDVILKQNNMNKNKSNNTNSNSNINYNNYNKVNKQVLRK